MFMNHETAHELLPWYLTGTLGEEERALVESHVGACITCHRDLRDERRLRDLVRSTETVNLSPEAGFARLTNCLGDLKSRTRPTQAVVGHWLSSLGVTARVAVASLALAAVAGLLWTAPPRVVPPLATDYVTLTGDSRSGTHLDIIFAADVTEGEMRALLDELGGTIVAGPTRIGRYTVRLNDPPAARAALTAIIRTVSDDARVQFAGVTLITEPVE